MTHAVTLVPLALTPLVCLAAGVLLVLGVVEMLSAPPPGGAPPARRRRWFLLAGAVVLGWVALLLGVYRRALTTPPPPLVEINLQHTVSPSTAVAKGEWRLRLGPGTRVRRTLTIDGKLASSAVYERRASILTNVLRIPELAFEQHDDDPGMPPCYESAYQFTMGSFNLRRLTPESPTAVAIDGLGEVGQQVRIVYELLPPE